MITRQAAIELAVRRHMDQHKLAWWQREAMDMGFFQPSPMACTAIRAHFRAIVRTYGVRAEPQYDGHSLRI